MEGAGDHKPKIEADAQNIINIKVQDQQGGVIQFRMKPHQRFEKVMQHFCIKKGVEMRYVKFLHDGQRVLADDTPEKLGMENDDRIDAVLEQIGGCQ